MVWGAIIAGVGMLGSALIQSQATKKQQAGMGTAGMFGGPRIRPSPFRMAQPPGISPEAPKPLGSEEPVTPPLPMPEDLSEPAVTQGENPWAALLRKERGG